LKREKAIRKQVLAKEIEETDLILQVQRWWDNTNFLRNQDNAEQQLDSKINECRQQLNSLERQVQEKTNNIARNNDKIVHESHVKREGFSAELNNKVNAINQCREQLNQVKEEYEGKKEELAEVNKQLKEKADALEECKVKQPKLIREKENMRVRVTMIQKQLDIKNEIIQSNDLAQNQSKIDQTINSFRLTKEKNRLTLEKLKQRNITINQNLTTAKTELKELERV